MRPSAFPRQGKVIGRKYSADPGCTPSSVQEANTFPADNKITTAQADKSRQIGNGSLLLMATLTAPENHLMLERDLRYAFWQNRAIVGAAIGTFIE